MTTENMVSVGTSEDEYEYLFLCEVCLFVCLFVWLFVCLFVFILFGFVRFC